MQDKHLQLRIEQCLTIAKASNCPRRKFGAMLLDPTHNLVLMDAYNGGPRGGGRLCGGRDCLRDQLKIPSGEQNDVGCFHAEQNLICNCAANGVSMRDKWVLVTGEPCKLCAKLLHHAGVSQVIIIRGGYAAAENGIDYLIRHGVNVQYVSGPADPRKDEPAEPSQPSAET